MKKKIAILLCASALAAAFFAGCGEPASNDQAPAQNTETQNTETEEADAKVADSEDTNAAASALEDGVYMATFDTDSSMFHVNESCTDGSVLTVENGEMVIHVTLVSKNIVNLYPGSAADAETDEANWLQPTEDEVTYSDGYKETVYGFDVPVPAIDEEFPLALIGTKENWYDHMVKVTDVRPAE